MKKVRPDETILRDLYERQRLTTRQIADIYAVSHMAVKRWIHFYGITPRAANRGLLNRGLTPPTADELRQLVHVEHLSYATIARRYGASETALHAWLDKFGIPRSSWAIRKLVYPSLPDESELRRLYEIEGLPTSAIAAQFGVSANTVLRHLERLGIPVRLNGFDGGKRFLCVDGHEVRSVYEQRVDDWLTANGIAHEYEPRAPFDRRHCADFLAGGYYIEIWGVTDSARYRERRDRKRALYRAHDIPLIEITPWSLHLPRANWQELLAEKLIPAVPPIADMRQSFEEKRR